MKKYTYTYRKRGLPDTPGSVGEVEANNYHEAVALASKQAGEDYVIINVKKEDGEDDIQGLSESNKQSNT